MYNNFSIIQDIQNKYELKLLELLNGYTIEWIGDGSAPPKPQSISDILQNENANNYMIYRPDSDGYIPMIYAITSYTPHSDPVYGDSDFLDSEITTLQETLKDSKIRPDKNVSDKHIEPKADDKKSFALTPKDKEYYETSEDKTNHDNKSAG